MTDARLAFVRLSLVRWRLISFLGAGLLVNGCGLKGDLYLPEPETEASAAAEEPDSAQGAPVDEDEQEEAPAATILEDSSDGTDSL